MLEAEVDGGNDSAVEGKQMVRCDINVKGFHLQVQRPFSGRFPTAGARFVPRGVHRVVLQVNKHQLSVHLSGVTEEKGGGGREKKVFFFYFIQNSNPFMLVVVDGIFVFLFCPRCDAAPNDHILFPRATRCWFTTASRRR